jgi:Protein of unknown function (DUF1279)
MFNRMTLSIIRPVSIASASSSPSLLLRCCRFNQKVWASTVGTSPRINVSVAIATLPSTLQYSSTTAKKNTYQRLFVSSTTATPVSVSKPHYDVVNRVITTSGCAYRFPLAVQGTNRSYSSNQTKQDSNTHHIQTDTQPQTPFVPMTAQEEAQEKVRVSQLTTEEKDREIRHLNRQIATLEMKRRINTGELYTWSGRYKALARDYGMPLLVWYWTIWFGTGIVCYATITLFNVDVMYLLQQIDVRTGYAISEQVNPEYGKIGMVLLVNEMIEPVRLPVVILTVKPVIDRFFPPKF